MDQAAATILLNCLRYDSNETKKKEQLAHISAEDWQAVVWLAQQHTVAPFLYHYLHQLGIEVPDDLTEELRQASLKNTSRNIQIYRELGNLMEELREKDIPVVTLKGAYLAERIYANMSLRSMVDIDLLVRKDDLVQVEQALMIMGYRLDDHEGVVIGQKNRHFVYRHPKRDFHFEIHWALFEAENPFQIDMPGLWSRTETVELAQAHTLTMSTEDLLVYLCMHAANHFHLFGMRISMFCDIGEVVRRKGLELDWQSIATRAQQWGALCSVYFILRLAKELLDVAVPAEWLATIQPEDFEENYLILGRERVFSSYMYDKNLISSKNFTRLWHHKGLRHKLVLIRDSFLPSHKVMAQMYPAKANSLRIYLYYPVRWKDVFERNGKMLIRLMQGDPKIQSEAIRVYEITTLSMWMKSG